MQQRARLYLADEQLLQSVTSVQQLANMETELEQALERVRARKVLIDFQGNPLICPLEHRSLYPSLTLSHRTNFEHVSKLLLQSYVSSAYQAASAMQRQQHEFLGNSYQQVLIGTSLHKTYEVQ